MSLMKNVAEYDHKRKWRVEFLRKFGCRGIKIARVNSHHQIYQFTLFSLMPLTFSDVIMHEALFSNELTSDVHNLCNFSANIR